MSQLTLEQRKSLEQALRVRSIVLRGEITAALRQQDTPETAHLANRFEETGDDVLADIELSLDIASVERDMGELRSVVEALGRIDSPGYGICSDCDAAIPFARLQAEPAARRCVACQERHEHSHAGGTHSSL
ncbi:MAG: hypothetical protein A3H35_08580 [Betaproteobacteria bacterium RIFCSPLOWO2_02_FULL_62_17]|nr:MAG: hypothetical protein A3H35_08580 [Betaproteobacteria bacterium RIFCSPLOWO2_02_FULL_62_17]